MKATALRERFEHIESDEDVEEILKLAIRKDAPLGGGVSLRERLDAAANELGISDEALAAAEAEYRSGKNEEKLREEYQKARKSKAKSESLGLLSPILIVLAIDFFTSNMVLGRLSWSLLVAGILVAVGLGKLVPVMLNPEGSDEEFDEWLRKREKREEKRRRRRVAQ
ncbi:MAG: hypothetical protein ACOCX1_01555 [Fimbriimonadaceae bacterium]